jgi:hypothetical protein
LEAQKSPLALERRRALWILVSWPLPLAGIVRRHARHVMMVVTMMMAADFHIY